MAHKKNTTNLTELLLQYVTQPDPMLSMLEWLCTELMEVEVDQQRGPWSVHAQAYHFRCTRRTGFGNS